MYQTGNTAFPLTCVLSVKDPEGKVAEMQSFIVLGIIPGTNIQTNLNFWLVVAGLLGILMLRGWIVALRRSMRIYMGMRKIARTINSCEMRAAF